MWFLHGAEPARAQFVLFGGEPQICSSMTPEHCRGQPDWPEQALTETLYRIERARIIRWALAQQLGMEDGEIHRWTDSLLSLVEDEPSDLSRLDFIAALQRSHAGAEPSSDASSAQEPAKTFWAGLDPAVGHGLLDYFQLQQPERQELVSLNHSADAGFITGLKAFVDHAAAVSQRERPLIAVSTAAARDPYAQLARYEQALEQAGADVVWLPLDAAVRRARSDENCLDLARYQVIELGVHDRQRHVPERFREQVVFCLDRNAGMETVASVDGLLLNNGSTERLFRAFHDPAGNPTVELEVLRRRLSDGQIVVSGAGAGAMVLAGDGLGVLPFAEIVTEMSERRGQIALARTILAQRERYGLGIEASSALVLEPIDDERSDSPPRKPVGLPSYRLSASSNGGIWLLDRGPEPQTDSDDDKRATISIRRLAAGSSMRFDPAAGFYARSPRIERYDPEDCRIIDDAASFEDLGAPSGMPGGASAVCYRWIPAGGGTVDWLPDPVEPSAHHSMGGLLILGADSVITTAAPD